MSQPSQPDSGLLAGPAKLDAVTRLMDKLSLDAKGVPLTPDERDAALEQLKVYGRDPSWADSLYTPKGIATLALHAFDSPSSKTSRNALRCIANAMLLRPETRQMFVDLGLEAKACKRLRSESWEDEFLVSRIIFLTTYDTKVDLDVLVRDHQLAEIICHNLGRHAKLLAAPSAWCGGAAAKAREDPIEEPALVETAKLVFNITTYCPSAVDALSPAIGHIVALLWKHDVSATRPLDPPFGPLVNALLNLRLESDKAQVQSALFPKKNPEGVVARLIEILDRALSAYQDSELDAYVAPLVGTLRTLHEISPAPVRAYMRERLLPTAEDRQRVLGRSKSMTSRLLANSANPMTPNLREVISRLLFEMSDEDSQKFVDNVGYGFASGLLFQKNLPIPQSASEAYSTAEDSGSGSGSGSGPKATGTKSPEAAGRPVNPITGQFLDRERTVEVPQMSDDEKMREAERLFVLFERLRENGLIQVQNPLRTAVEEGRFEELADDAEDVD